MNNLFNYQAPELFEQLSNSPDMTYLGDLFNEEDEEERKRRLALLGNYNQRQTAANPQINTERNPNLFDMFYL